MTCRITELYANSRSGEHASCIRWLTRAARKVRARASSARLDKLKLIPQNAGHLMWGKLQLAQLGRQPFGS